MLILRYRASDPPQVIPDWLGWARIREDGRIFKLALAALDAVARPFGFRAGFSVYGNNGLPDDGFVFAMFVQRP